MNLYHVYRNGLGIKRGTDLHFLAPLVKWMNLRDCRRQNQFVGLIHTTFSVQNSLSKVRDTVLTRQLPMSCFSGGGGGGHN